MRFSSEERIVFNDDPDEVPRGSIHASVELSIDGKSWEARLLEFKSANGRDVIAERDSIWARHTLSNLSMFLPFDVANLIEAKDLTSKADDGRGYAMFAGILNTGMKDDSPYAKGFVDAILNLQLINGWQWQKQPDGVAFVGSSESLVRQSMQHRRGDKFVIACPGPKAYKMEIQRDPTTTLITNVILYECTLSLPGEKALWRLSRKMTLGYSNIQLKPRKPASDESGST